MRIRGLPMKKLFRKWGTGGHFDSANLTEVPEEISNPARGWYQIYTFLAEREPDFKELEWCVDQKDTLALLVIDIGFFRERDLDEETLERIGRILCFFQQRGCECILRAVYDHEGKAMEREPFFFAQVLRHLRQICGIVSQYAEAVFVYQGMLVGNWGEMHTSRFLHEDMPAQMAEVLRTGMGDKVYLAVRRPMYWRMLHESPDGRKAGEYDSMGLFDDGMFGSAGHLGTFGHQAREEAGWNAPWSREDELTFEEEIGRYAPNGGEAVYGEGFVEGMTPGKVIQILRQMRVTYLNRVYDPQILNIWKEWSCLKQGVWADKSLLEYVGAHLGYRFLVRKVSMRWNRGGGKGVLEVEIENVGFGGLYQEAELCPECLDENGVKSCLEKRGPMRGWGSGEARKFSWAVDVCACELYLTARRKRDGAVIRFANRSDSEGRVYLGSVRL